MYRLNDIEFFNSPEGYVYIVKGENDPHILQMTGMDNMAFINSFLSYMEDFYTQAFYALSEFHQNCKKNPILYKYRIALHFIRCNFGEYDTKDKDIDIYGRFNFEQVACPLRGTGFCKLEGICCRPRFNTTLSDREKEILQLFVGGQKSEDIAEMLCISCHTVNNHRRNIHAKLGTHSMDELVRYWYERIMQ